MTKDQKQHLFELFTGHGADLLSEAQHAELQDLLKNSSEARKLWFLYQDNEIALQRLAKIEGVVPFPAGERKQNRWNVFLKIAAVFLFCGVMFLGLNRKPSPVLAEMLEVQNTKWSSGALPTEAGSKLGAGRMHLVEGIAKLRFVTGVDLTLEGPAEIELLGNKECRLYHGAVIAKVPKSARGFSVLTPSVTVVDLGTEFSVSTDHAGSGCVRVMKGEVQVFHQSGAPKLSLHTGEMTFVSMEQTSPVTVLDLEPQSARGRENGVLFPMELNTRIGRGAAVYVSEPRTLNHQSETLLFLKHCAEPGYGRKVILRFDLSGLGNLNEIQQARLAVNFEPTGYGFASRGGDARIAVFAVTRDDADLWAPGDLNWSNQPAFDPSAGKVDLSQATRVGEFTVPAGVKSGTFFVEDSRLWERIKADPNRLLTLILVRENQITEEGGLVLGIAGNNHPRLLPPTIQFR